MSVEGERIRPGLRPLPFRGDLIAAGAVPLAVGAVLLSARMDGEWPAGVRFVVLAAVAGLLLVLAWRAPVEGPAPRAYVSVLLATAFPVVAASLGDLAEALGGAFWSPGSQVWIAALLGAGFVALARARNSALCTLLGAGSLVVALLAAWRWVFATESDTPARWLLLAAIVGLALGAVWLRDGHRAHAVALVDVAGLSALWLGVKGTVLLSMAPLDRLPERAGWGWQLVLLAVGLGLVAYGAVDRERGPAWLGAGVLATFVLVAAPEESLLWWPLLLLVLGGAVIAAGLRPTTPAPPPPDADAPPAESRPLHRDERS